jgi:hypothetical protein
VLTSTHNLSVWSSSSLRRWHPRSSVPLVLTRHSLLILNERWTRMINLSMFFYYVMVLLLFWGHKPCMGFFFWRFNAPDAFICYPGSIEKLKLLGVTYLPTFWPLSTHQFHTRWSVWHHEFFVKSKWDLSKMTSQWPPLSVKRVASATDESFHQFIYTLRDTCCQIICCDFMEFDYFMMHKVLQW